MYQLVKKTYTCFPTHFLLLAQTDTVALHRSSSCMPFPRALSMLRSCDMLSFERWCDLSGVVAFLAPRRCAYEMSRSAAFQGRQNRRKRLNWGPLRACCIETGSWGATQLKPETALAITKSVSDAFGCSPPRPRAAPRLAVPDKLRPRILRGPRNAQGHLLPRI